MAEDSSKTSGRRRGVIASVAVVAVLVGGVGLALFQPWKLFVDDVVEEDLPAASAPASASAEPAQPDPEESASAAAEPDEPAGPVRLAEGDFISHEHTTTGSVAIVELPDGSRVLRLEDLNTSNGPDLKVWLTDAPVIEGTAGWGVFDDGRWVDLGKLKGNIGSQNYEIPADVALEDYSSVSIWCDRFNVSFGAAELAPA